MKKVGIASDHAGFDLKEQIKGQLDSMGYEVVDYGCYSNERVDYPDFAHALANGYSKGEITTGIVICGSGNGINMSVNKHSDIRSALCWNTELAALAKQHNNANVLALPARFISEEMAKNCVEAFFNASFEGGRHENRVAKISC